MKKSIRFSLGLMLSCACLYCMAACGGAAQDSGSGSDGTQDGVTEPQSVALSALYPWVGTLAEEDILRIRVETSPIGVAPGLLRDIAYSSDRDDIKDVYTDVLSSSLSEIPEEEGQITGGGYVKYDIFTETETFSLTFSNQVVYVGETYYRFDGKLCRPGSPSLTCKAFITYAEQIDRYDTYEIFTCGEESVKLADGTGLGQFEFTEYTGECDMNAKLRLTSETTELNILSETLFMIEGDYTVRIFQITGEKDFSDYFGLIR